MRRRLPRPTPLPIAPGQESVWAYPRPPAVERTPRHLCVELGGEVLAETRRALRVLETSHPPVYYVPPDDVRLDLLVPVSGGSFCEWKGRAMYYDADVTGRRVERVAWTYPDPTSDQVRLKDHVAFYAARVDRCTVDGEVVVPQPGDFYGGWITDDVVGPFKGDPGTEGW